MKNILKVTILFCLIISTVCINISFASNGSVSDLSYVCEINYNASVGSQFNKDIAENGTYLFSYQTIQANGVDDTDVRAGIYNDTGVPLYYTFYEDANGNVCLIIGCEKGTSNYVYLAYKNIGYSYPNGRYATFTGLTSWINHPTYNIAYRTNSNSNIPEDLNHYDSLDEAVEAIEDYIANPPDPAPVYTKNANVDEFIANTLISMGIHYNTYSDALSVASSAWNYIIDDENWYIGTGYRNDKDIKWNIDTAVSYANAQSNNYKDWYNGYKVNKDLTIALAKFISDNYTASTVGEGTLAGYSVKYNSNYNYGTTTGTSGFSGSFGSSPNALSFYPASTITYFNGAYLHDNDVIDQDEFVYSPPDVRKFIGYPSTSGIIDSPDNTPASGIITDGNGDTVYNIDLDFPSLDWLADAIQSLLDFLDRLITTLADFLTQILDAILSLFSDAFENLTTFGQGLIEWLYEVVAGFSSFGSSYIPASLWAVILPFILINIGVGLIMFVLRSH